MDTSQGAELKKCSVEGMLREYAAANQSVVYFAAAGNAGDSLISAGFFMLADRIGIKYRTVTSLDGVRNDDILLFSGGGGLVEAYGNVTLELVRHAALRASRVIVLPNTLHGNRRALEELPHNVTIFARDERSYAYGRSLSNFEGALFLDHDMAFHIDMDALLSRKFHLCYTLVDRPQNMVRALAYIALWIVGHLRRSVTTLRTDREGPRRGGEFIRRALDYSEVANFGHGDKNRCLTTAFLLAHLIALSRSIRTDRLHVGICAYLLGKELELIDSGYGKIRAVADMSMPGVSVITN